MVPVLNLNFIKIQYNIHEQIYKVAINEIPDINICLSLNIY